MKERNEKKIVVYDSIFLFIYFKDQSSMLAFINYLQIHK